MSAKKALLFILLGCGIGCHGDLSFNHEAPDGGSACVPGATLSCYDGPAGTEGRGICKAGVQTCGANGTFGPCIGEITPRPEDCCTPEDDDCDGMTPSCTGDLLWSKRFGDVFDDQRPSVAVDNNGDVILTGSFRGVVDFGGGPLANADSSDVFLAKFDLSGKHLWSKRFGGAGSQYASGIAMDGSGDMFVAGGFEGTIDFGGGPLVSAGGSDVFLAKFDPSGKHLWSNRFGDADAQISSRVATDSVGNIFTVGQFNGTIDFGGGPLTNPSNIGDWDIYLAKFDPSGKHLWSKRFGGTNFQTPSSVAVDSAGDVLVAGQFFDSIDLGTGAIPSAGGLDGFLVKFDSSGNYLWSKHFGDASNQYAAGVTTDKSRNVLFTGDFSGAIDLGGGWLTASGGLDIFLANFDASGKHLWSKRFGSKSSLAATAVAVDSGGCILIDGSMNGGEVDFGGGPLASAGLSDVVLAKFDPAGNHLWSKRFGDVLNQDVYGLAVDSRGNVLISGDFQGTLDLGGTPPLKSVGGYDIFLAKFAP